VYDLLGQEVSTLFEGVRKSGEYKIAFDGGSLASGVYIYRMRASEINGGQASSHFVTRNLMMLK
jgi:hypothetical protein